MIHHDLERLLAEVDGTERTLSFPTDYAATVGAIATLEPDVVFSDAANRQAVADACRLSGADLMVYDHCDVPNLRATLAERADGNAVEESWLIATASVFDVDGAVAPLSAICDAAAEFGAWVLVDERHATGLYVDGGGVVQAEGQTDRVDVQVGSLETALASQGGYVAGSDALIRRLLEDDAFGASTGLAPAAAAAASEALHVSRHGDCRHELWENVAHLRDGLEAMGYDVGGDSQILPVRAGDPRVAADLAAGVRDRGIVTSVVGPSGDGGGDDAVRITPMATHDREDVVRCLEAFQVAGEDVGLL